MVGEDYDFGLWRFSLFGVGCVEEVLVCAACEYDAWVTLCVVRELRVDLEGLSRDEEG